MSKSKCISTSKLREVRITAGCIFITVLWESGSLKVIPLVKRNINLHVRYPLGTSMIISSPACWLISQSGGSRLPIAAIWESSTWVTLASWTHACKCFSTFARWGRSSCNQNPQQRSSLTWKTCSRDCWIDKRRKQWTCKT